MTPSLLTVSTRTACGKTYKTMLCALSTGQRTTGIRRCGFHSSGTFCTPCSYSIGHQQEQDAAAKTLARHTQMCAGS